MARLAAGARKRADGTLEKRFTVEGKRYSVYGKTAAELTEKETDLRRRIAAGNYTKNAAVTFEKYFSGWIKRKEKTVKPDTLAAFNSTYKVHFSRAFGAQRVAKIERRQIIELQAALAETHKPATVNRIIGTLHSILKDAERDGIIDRNPAEYIKGLKDESPKASETIHRALTEDEQAAFMEAARGSYYYELFAFLLCTGMRIGEAGALTWADIDYKANMIHITKTITKKQRIGTPKTRTSKRDIPLTDTAKKVLRAQREKMGNPLVGRVFQTVTGKPVGTNIGKEVDKITAAAGIERIGVHALRDTFATRFIEQGGTPQTLKSILGHSSLAMTMDLYAHVLPNTKAAEMERLQIII